MPDPHVAVDAGPTGAPPPHVLVVFGAVGDLARRKLLPALYHLHLEGLLPAEWRLVGNTRGELSDEDFRTVVRGALLEFAGCPVEGDAWAVFSQRLTYCSGEFTADSAGDLEQRVHALERDMGAEGVARRLHYLSVPPSAFPSITEGLGASALTERGKVVFEKPFGNDLASFHALDELVRATLAEEQVYRIDHFLAKEAVQNTLALRFANGMFEPVWNRTHIDSVQIDVPETLEVGTRAGFYEHTGALRDMVATHLLQVLSIIAMEPPTLLGGDPLLGEKVKVFESIQPLSRHDVVYGQYEGYRDAPGVAADSRTETYAAAQIEIDNWRWADVPFLLRTGKAMAEDRQVVTLVFKRPPLALFPDMERLDQVRDHLRLDLSGDGGVAVSFLSKVPGAGLHLGRARMAFSYGGAYHSALVGPYERLLLDALLGDRTLFTRADGVERTWELVQSVLDHPPETHRYPRGSWGPREADTLVAPRRWLLPEPAVTPEAGQPG